MPLILTESTEMENILLKIEKFIGSAKFAVIIIVIFALALSVGTFVESAYDTDYASRLIYKSWPFMLLQLAMFISIFIATIRRFPYRKRLLGFYILHLGLLLIFGGSFITYMVGIDGSMQLLPNTPNRLIQLPFHQVEVTSLDKKEVYSLDMPYRAFPTDLDLPFKGYHLKNYYPFSKLETKWMPSKMKEARSSHYLLKNENFTRDFILSSHPKSLGKSTVSLGPLNAHYLPSGLAPCFEDKSSYLIWDLEENKCHPLNSQSEEELSTTIKGKKYTFTPKASPIPIDPETKKFLPELPLRLFNKSLFQEKVHLFSFGDQVAFYDRNEKRWYVKKLVENGSGVDLPWMDFTLSLIRDSHGFYPAHIPVESPPKKQKERIQALEIEYQGQTHWLTSQKPLNLDHYIFRLRPKVISLPFEITLNKFNMDKDPGTQNPASYESFVSVFDGTKNQDKKVYMNNPLDWDQFTFYQASYFPLENGLFGSVLSANYDPGRFLKYFGSLLLVLGSFWHFVITRRRKKRR